MLSLDIGFGILFLIVVLWGAIKGLLWTVVRIASFAGVFIVISIFGREFRYHLGDLLHVSPAVAVLITYVLIFVVMMIAAKILYMILKKIMKTLDLGCANRIAGGVLGAIAYFLILAMLVILIDLSPLSINGRGVRPYDHRLGFQKFSDELTAEINSRRSSLSGFEIDKILEEMEKAKEQVAESGNSEDRAKALEKLYSQLRESFAEQDFEQLQESLVRKEKARKRFRGKDIIMDSYVLEGIVEPLADYIEEKFMGFDLS